MTGKYEDTYLMWKWTCGRMLCVLLYKAGEQYCLKISPRSAEW